MCMCVYIHIYIYIYIYIYMYMICIHIWRLVPKAPAGHAHCICIYIYIYIYTRNYARAIARASFRSSPSGMCNVFGGRPGKSSGVLGICTLRSSAGGRPRLFQGPDGAPRGPREPPERLCEFLGYPQGMPQASPWLSRGSRRASKNISCPVSGRPVTPAAFPGTSPPSMHP